MVKGTSVNNIQGLAVGLNKGFIVKKPTPVKAARVNKQGAKNRSREVRKLVRSVVGLTQFEKRLLEMFRVDSQKVQKRAFKMLKKRIGTRDRALKKKNELLAIIKKGSAAA